ncbi:MAG: hydrogenase expression/formation protein HypE [Bacteroidales bacterium]
MKKEILLGHGSGGKLSHELISGLFVRYFDNEILGQQTDAALLEMPEGQLAFTTDSFVVDPVFFPGGNIGKLAVAGTVNDLAVTGARPLYLSASFILEEGLGYKDLEEIVASMADEAQKAGIRIVTGDTKVVNRGKCDKVFITTSGVGILPVDRQETGTGNRISSGDMVLVSGTLADHGMCIMAAREGLGFRTTIESDCASLNGMISELFATGADVKFIRDATRGGVGTVLVEIAQSRNVGLELDEKDIPVKEEVRGICELLGFDPMYVANEGKVVIVVAAADTGKVLEALHNHPLGSDAAIIGKVVNDHPGKVWMTTGIGGKRIVDMLAGEQLPRIC